MNQGNFLSSNVDNFARYRNFGSRLIWGKHPEDVLVSIVIPTYKRLELLALAMESAVNQTNADSYEIIVIDNDHEGGNEVLELVKSINAENLIYYKNTKNLGMFGNWNRGIELSKGEFVTLLHDDDTLDDSFLQKVTSSISKLDKSQGVILFSLVNMVDERKSRGQELNPFFKSLYFKFVNKGKISQLSINHYAIKNQQMGTLGTVFNRQDCVELGGFDEDSYPISDFVFWCRWLERYQVIYRLNEALANYRIAQNESMKEEVLEQFCEKGFALRAEVIERNNLSFVYRLINRAMFYASSYRLYSCWLNTDVLFKKRGSGFLNRLLCSKPVYLAITSFTVFFQAFCVSSPANIGGDDEQK